MRIAVLGSPSCTNYSLLARVLDALPASQILLAGTGPLAQQVAWYAIAKGLASREFTDDVKRHGSLAKRIRNQQMVEASDLVVVLWDGRSAVVARALEYARDLRKRIQLVPC